MHFLFFFFSSMLQKKQRSFKQHKHKNSPFQPRVLLFVSTTEEFSKPVHKKQTRKTRPIALLFKTYRGIFERLRASYFLFQPHRPNFRATNHRSLCFIFFPCSYFLFQPHRNFRTRNQKTPFFAACFTSSRFLFTHFREKKTKLTPHTARNNPPPKISTNQAFLYFLFLQRRTPILKSTNVVLLLFQLRTRRNFRPIHHFTFCFNHKEGTKFKTQCRSL